MVTVMVQTARTLADPAPLEFVPWDVFLRDYFTWVQGEHVSLIGPTGSGKTTLALRILNRRRYVTALATKKRDESMDYLLTQGYRLEREWPPPPNVEKVVLWPRHPQAWNPFHRTAMTELAKHQQGVFAEVLNEVYDSGSWCLFIDELWYLDVFLGLRKIVNLLLQQARSNNVSMVMGTQRPVYVTRSMFSEATHLFLWRLTDMADRKRLLEISGGVDKRYIMQQVAQLGKHDVFYVDTRRGVMVATRVEL